MEQYIKKSALAAEIKARISDIEVSQKAGLIKKRDADMKITLFKSILSLLDTLDVKEMDEQKERMSECPYRQVGCTMYKDKILECNGTCGWVVDYPKLKELKAQKGE